MLFPRGTPQQRGATQLLSPQNVGQEWGMPSHMAHKGPDCLQRTEATTPWEASAVTKEQESTILQPLPPRGLESQASPPRLSSRHLLTGFLRQDLLQLTSLELTMQTKMILNS